MKKNAKDNNFATDLLKAVVNAKSEKEAKAALKKAGVKNVKITKF